MSGKGSGRRPLSVDEQTFADNWSRIFNSGLPERSKGSGSNPETGIAPNDVGSNPTAAANFKPFRAIDFIDSEEMLEAYVTECIAELGVIYIDDATGK